MAIPREEPLITGERARLGIIMYEMPEEHPVGVNPGADEFQTGSFSRIIKMENDEI